MKSWLRRLLLRAARTRVGYRILWAILFHDPTIAYEPISDRYFHDAGFERVEDWPERLEGFEDLLFLFTLTPMTAGVSMVSVDEAAHLFTTARASEGPLVEIGRARGGTTFLLAAAAGPGRVWSYELPTAGTARRDGVLGEAMDRYGLGANLVQGDSRSAAPPPEPPGFVLIDGDHEYDGVLADYERWRPLLAAGGHLFFHDTDAPGVEKVVAKAAADEQLVRRPAPGRLAHFLRA